MDLFEAIEGYEKLWEGPPMDEDGNYEPPDTLDVLAASRQVEVAAAEKVTRYVGFARQEGATWEEIGEALGTTRQAAQMRFGRDVGAAS